MPPLPAVLVNPNVACPTGRVYRAYDVQAHQGTADVPVLPAAFGDVETLARTLGACRNDLEAAAQGVSPAITDVLAGLRGQPETLLARLSGSGATCFALCASPEAAAILAERLRRDAPRWWVRPCSFRDPAAA
jgi:4-diphosphocytidyl-2-C-methyl-D-erythritol kinase